MKFNLLFHLFLLAVFAGGIQSTANAGEKSVAGSAEEICPVLVGTVIPDVKVTSADGDEVSLLKLVKSKPTVLIFYRGGW